MALDDRTIEEIVELTVREELAEGDVASVEISTREDEFEADVIDIKIILNKTIERNIISRFSLKLRHALLDANKYRFPLVSFIAKKEFNRRNR